MDALNPQNYPSGKNPLDISFSQYSLRGTALRTQCQGEILVISESAFKHLSLSTIARLAQIAENHPDALRFFPTGCKLELSASGESGDYIDPGYLNLYCSLYTQNSDGDRTFLGKEEIYRSSDTNRTIESSLEHFLSALESPVLNSNGGIL